MCPAQSEKPQLAQWSFVVFRTVFFPWNRLCEETTIIQSAKSINILHPCYFACSFLWLHHEARTVERSQGPDIGVLQHWRPVLWRWQLLGALCSLGRQVSSKGPQMVGEPMKKSEVSASLWLDSEVRIPQDLPREEVPTGISKPIAGLLGVYGSKWGTVKIPFEVGLNGFVHILGMFRSLYRDSQF